MKRPAKTILYPIAALLAAVALYIILYKNGGGELPLSPTPPPKQARLVFAGDLMQHMPQVNAARNKAGGYDYEASFQYIATTFQQADIAILNLETTLTPNNKYTGYPRFRSPSQLATTLKNIGIDVALLANNHICDGGHTGIAHTTHLLDSLHIAHTGAFTTANARLHNHPLHLEANDIHFALLNYTYDTNGIPIPHGQTVNLIDTNAIINDLKQIDRNHVDAIIVCFHWGEEYARRPNNEQKQLAKLCHDHGAEIIIGSHPHVIQPFEKHTDNDSITRQITVYSLGNLVSNQRKRYCDGGLIVTLDIEKQHNQPIQITPHYSLVWVQTPRYHILTTSIADTLTMPKPSRTAYQQFCKDARQLLQHNRIFQERPL